MSWATSELLSTNAFSIGQVFENIVGKEENAGKQHFSISHKVFHPNDDRLSWATSELLFTNAFSIRQVSIS